MPPIRPVGAAALMALVVAVGFFAARPVQGDQRDDPATVSDPAANITDTYFYPSPTNSNNVIVAMNVYPGIKAGSGTTTYFNSNVLYQMKFDSRIAGEAVGSTPTENVVIQFLFTSPTSTGVQTAIVYGPDAPNNTGTNNSVLSAGSVGNGPLNTSFQTSSGLTVFAGARADPFFFDYGQFYNILPNRNSGSTAQSCLPGVGSGSCPQGFNNPGTNTQANSNVLSIVVELPKSLLEPNSTGPKIAYWATTGSPSGQ